MLTDHMISINLLLNALTKLNEKIFQNNAKKQILSILTDLNREYIEVNETIFLVLYLRVEHQEWKEALGASERMLEALEAFEA